MHELIGLLSERCRLPEHDGRAADLLVIFGITVDLARKVTFRALPCARSQGARHPILGVARDDIWIKKSDVALDQGWSGAL